MVLFVEESGGGLQIGREYGISMERSGWHLILHLVAVNALESIWHGLDRLLILFGSERHEFALISHTGLIIVIGEAAPDHIIM